MTYTAKQALKLATNRRARGEGLARALVHGEAVHVFQVWASNGNGEAPSFAWLSGYSFLCVEADTGCVLVRCERGVHAGCAVRFLTERVRRA